MKKLAIILLIVGHSLTAQNYIGFNESNYAGILSSSFNPANVADNLYKLDIAIVGAKFQVANNYAYISRNDLSFSNPEIQYKDLNGKNIELEGQLNFEIGAMFSINEKSGMSVSIRPRVSVFGSGINPDAIDNLREELKNNKFSIEDKDMNSRGVSWMEYSVAYGRVLLDENEHYLKGGIDLRLLQGIGAFFFNTNDLSISYDPAEVNDITNASGDITLVYSNGLNPDGKSDVEVQNNVFGFGFGAGLIYEWRPDYKAHKRNVNGSEKWTRNSVKYKLKAGVSLVDIGSLKYNRGEFASSVAIVKNEFSTASIPTDDIEAFNNFASDPNNKIFKMLDLPENFNMKLPAKLNLMLDYNIYQKFYIATTANINLNRENSFRGVKEFNYYALSARYEGDIFTYSLPVSYDELRGLNLGSVFRIGPFFIGSSNLSNLLFKKEISTADIYFGFRASFKHKS